MQKGILTTCVYAIASHFALAGPNFIHQFINQANVVDPRTFKGGSSTMKPEIDLLVAAMRRADLIGSDSSVFSKSVVLTLSANDDSNFKSILRPELLDSQTVLLDPIKGVFILMGESKGTVYKFKQVDLIELKKIEIIAQQVAPSNGG